MDKKEPAASPKSKLQWRKGFLHDSKGKGKTILSPNHGIKEPLIILQEGFPQGLGSSPSFCCKLLGSKGTVKLLQFDFKDLAKEVEEADSKEETIWLLKKYKKI